MQEEIELILEGVHREGIEKLMVFLATSDFYKAPCSTKFHLAQPGGLAEHSLNVYLCAKRLNTNYLGLFSTDSIAIAALCHDLCKVNNYKELDEAPTDPQMNYLRSLARKEGLVALPTKLNKAYAGILIDWLLKGKPAGLEMPRYTPNYVVEDTLPLGHGEKSLYLVQQFIELTLDEALAIRWHMASFDAGIHFPYPSGYAYQEAVKKSKLVSIIQLADIEASNLLEV